MTTTLSLENTGMAGQMVSFGIATSFTDKVVRPAEVNQRLNAGRLGPVFGKKRQEITGACP